MTVNTFRMIFLGAGFSKPAGLPLASQLFPEVRSRIRQLQGGDNPLERDLQYYLEYLTNTEGFNDSIENLDIERFLSFLDVEHYLQLRGSDTWSAEGNETQLLVRHTIGYILSNRTPEKIPDLYKNFVGKLTTSDWIMTFNYDTLLERAMDLVGRPYRLFPDRYSNVNEYTGIANVDLSRKEVVILKMHGSIDWFDKTSFNEDVKRNMDSRPLPHIDHHPVFGSSAVFSPVPIVDGPRFANDPLLRIYRVKEPADIYASQNRYWERSPFLLNPSHSKLLYIKPLIEFWRGAGRSGGLQLGLGVIGYSLPSYDDYACQAIYKMMQNYQHVEPNLKIDERIKRPVRILDYRLTRREKTALRKRYGFVDAKLTEFRYDGFSDESIEWFME